MKRIEKYKKVDEIEKLLNFLFIVWSVCFLFTNTDKSLAFFYSLIYISMGISIGAFCNSIATSKCTFQYNHLRNVKNRRLIMVRYIPPLCDTLMDYLNGCSLSSELMHILNKSWKIDLEPLFWQVKVRGEWMVDFMEYMDVLTCHHLSLGACQTFFKVMLLIRQVCTPCLLWITALISNKKVNKWLVPFDWN